jgi:hypothetical protein
MKRPILFVIASPLLAASLVLMAAWLLSPQFIPYRVIPNQLINKIPGFNPSKLGPANVLFSTMPFLQRQALRRYLLDPGTKGDTKNLVVMSTPFTLGSSYQDLIALLLKSKDFSDRMDGASALGTFKDQSDATRASLAELFLSRDDSKDGLFECWVILDALVRAEPQKALPHLRSILSQPGLSRPKYAMAAAATFSASGAVSDSEVLNGSISGAEHRIRVFDLMLLGRSLRPEVLPILQMMTADPDEKVSSLARQKIVEVQQSLQTSDHAPSAQWQDDLQR